LKWAAQSTAYFIAQAKLIAVLNPSWFFGFTEAHPKGASFSKPFTAICFQTRHKLKYKTRCGASPCDPSCGGFDRVLL